MMDLTQKESLGEEDISESQKCCTDCKTTKTPLWRGGPAGPKTLCNACGIRQRKKRAVLGLRKASEKKKEASNGISASSDSASTTITTTSHTSDAKNGNNLSKSLKLRLMVLGKEVVLLQRQRSPIVRRQRRKEICEEEQAAVMLMSLSCGSVFA